MKSVDWHKLNRSRGASGRRGERKTMPRADFDDAEEGEVEVGKFERKEFGGGARAE